MMHHICATATFVVSAIHLLTSAEQCGIQVVLVPKKVSVEEGACNVPTWYHRCNRCRGRRHFLVRYHFCDAPPQPQWFHPLPQLAVPLLPLFEADRGWWNGGIQIVLLNHPRLCPL